MTPEQIRAVQESWEHVQPMREKAAELFYYRLFELDPSLRTLFKPDMASQRTKLMVAIGMVVASLGRIEKVLPTVRALGARHVHYGVKPAHFDTVGEALLWTLAAGLGERFTREVGEAWTHAYEIIASAMKEAMTESAAVA